MQEKDACDVKVDILSERCINILWTVDKDAVGGDFDSTICFIKATEVDSGKCAYSEKFRGSLPIYTNRGFRKFIFHQKNIELNKTYRFSVTYLKNNMQVLTLRSARTSFAYPRRGGVGTTSQSVASSNQIITTSSSGHTQVSSHYIQTRTTSSSQNVATSSSLVRPLVAMTSSLASDTASRQTFVAPSTIPNTWTTSLAPITTYSWTTAGVSTMSRSMTLTQHSSGTQISASSNQGLLSTRQSVVSTSNITTSNNVPVTSGCGLSSSLGFQMRGGSTSTALSPIVSTVAENTCSTHGPSAIVASSRHTHLSTSQQPVTALSSHVALSTSQPPVTALSSHVALSTSQQPVTALSSHVALSTSQPPVTALSSHVALSTSQQPVTAASRQICAVSAIQRPASRDRVDSVATSGRPQTATSTSESNSSVPKKRIETFIRGKLSRVMRKPIFWFLTWSRGY